MDKNRHFYTKIILKVAFFITAGLLLTGMAACIFKTGALEEDGYEGALYSNYELTYFAEEDFLTYRGLKVYTEYEDYINLTDLVKDVKGDISENRSLKEIYICMNPVNETDALDDLIHLVKKKDDVTFEILLSAPLLKDLAERTEEERSDYFDAISYLLAGLKECQNAYVYYVGNQEWLVINRAHYETELGFNETIADKMLCATFCDRLYTITEASLAEHRAETEKLLEQYERGVYTYPDLSDYQLVFLGDSIMGNYKGSYSIPGMIAGLTGAQAFNCGEGGVCAAKTEDSGWSAYRMAMGISDEGTRPLSDKGQYTKGVELFVTDYDSEKNTHIFIEFGINDFLKQTPLGSSANTETETEYYGALRMTVERLRKDYPQADICILTPTYVIPEEESEYTLEEYVLAATAVAEDLGITYIDMNTLMGIEKEAYVAYLEDECHLNEAGRLAYANVLIDYLNISDMVHEQE